MIRRDSMSFLHEMLEELEQEQEREQERERERVTSLRRSLRRSVAVQRREERREEARSEDEEDPPDLPTSPRPELADPTHASMSDGEFVEIVRQKRSFDLRTNRMYSPGGRHSLENRRQTGSSSTTSTVQTPRTAVDYDFSFWASNSPGISLLSPTRSTSFFLASPGSYATDTEQEDLPAWSSRVVANEGGSISTEEQHQHHHQHHSVAATVLAAAATTVVSSSSATMSSTVERRSISIDEAAGAVTAAAKGVAGYGTKAGGDAIESTFIEKTTMGVAGGNGMSGRSSSTSNFMTSSEMSGDSASPPISPGGRAGSQSESALDEMDDDDLLIGGGDLGRTRKEGGSPVLLCGLPAGEAKRDIQYQSLEDIRTAVSPPPPLLQHDLTAAAAAGDLPAAMGGDRWRDGRRRRSEGGAGAAGAGGEERRRSRAEITPSHSPSRDSMEGGGSEEDENGNGEEERESKSLHEQRRLHAKSSLQSSLERIDREEAAAGEHDLHSSAVQQSYLGVEMESEEEEYHEEGDDEDYDALEDEGVRRRMEEVARRNLAADLDVIDEENDESRSRSVSRHADAESAASLTTTTTERERATLIEGGGAGEDRDADAVSLSEPSDYAPSLFTTTTDGASTGGRQGDVSTCGSISYARTPERETASSYSMVSSSSDMMMTSSTTTTGSDDVVTSSRRGGEAAHAARALHHSHPHHHQHPSLAAAGRTVSNASSTSASSGAPSEPEDLAPGVYTSLSPMEETMPPMGLPLHRRAISNHETRHEEMQQAQRDSEIVRARSSGGRGSMSAGRCLSQVMTPVSLPHSPSATDVGPSGGRNLSSSDPALNELDAAEMHELQRLQQQHVEELQYGESRDGARQPPPVLLQRKQSSANSWRSPFAVATARGVMNPRVQVPGHGASPGGIGGGAGGAGGSPGSRTATPPRERHGTLPAGMGDERPGERSRIDKKKESGGSTRVKMLDSLSNAFFSERKKNNTKKTSERSLDGLMQQFGMRNAVHPRRGTAMNDGHLAHTVEGLPDEIASVLGDDHGVGGSVRLPSMDRSPSAIRSPNGGGAGDDYSFELRSLSLSSDLWDRFGLFEAESHSAWHEKYATEGMSSRELKKQDAIYELIGQERKHCAHLAFLKRGYRARLVEEHVLSAADADKLIPDVLDAQLAFHLHLLERLVERQRAAPRVATVADIIAEELGEAGRFTTRAVDAYTSFGAAKEGAEAYYEQLMAKGGRFAVYYNKLQTDSNYRRYEYKTLLTVIIGRPTKYPLMLDQMLKNEEEPTVKEQTREAAEAARRFAARIDNGLQVCQMSKKWEEIKAQLEPSSKTMLHDGQAAARPFTMEDLKKDTFAGDSRKIHCMGEVMVKAASVFLILFDDILVVLQRKGGRWAFIQHEQAVLPVCSLHIRSTERQNAAFVISNCKPALLQFDFVNRASRLMWVKALESAIAKAPKEVRMTPRVTADSRAAARERAAEEERVRRAEEEWLRRLDAIFEERKPEEAGLASYFDSRRRWFDELRRHVCEMPYKSRNEMPDKVRQCVRARFRELRAARCLPLAEMVERCTTAREGDLWAFFDDKHEMAAGPSSDSDSSGSARSGKHPRRIQTFHGTTSETREKSSIRRHTTVPKMSECGSTASADGGLQRLRAGSDSEESDEEETTAASREEGDAETREEREERIRMRGVYKVPLSLPLRARRASTRLVDDVVQLRLENSALRNQAALDKTRIAFLERARAPGYAAIVAPTETMEALRRKEQEVRDEETRVRDAEERSKARMAAWAREMQEQKERLAAQEAELERKWLVYKEHTSTPIRSSSQKENGEEVSARREKRVERTASNCSELSPALKGLSLKSETRRKK